MSSTCVVGLQWGDEAKGKVVDLLAQTHDVAVRFNGGANAGHTVVVGEETYKLSLIPSAILHPKVTCVIGNGMAVGPATLVKEMDGLAARGIDLAGRLLMSDRAHVIMPYHLEEERLSEEAAQAQAIGTTRRGIGPCYADKAGRGHAIRLHDLVDPVRLRRRLAEIVPHKNRVLQALASDAEQFDPETIAREYDQYAERLRPFIADTFWYLQHALRDRKSLMFEAAQGTLLDVDHGSFPFVTSSNSSACGLQAGCGVSIRCIDRIIGIAKAYTTRVGGGPFPTELTDATGQLIRDEGREYGTVTGRPRRCGWFDAVACRYTTLLNGVDRLALMRLDVLSKLERIEICAAYEIDGARTTEFPVHVEMLEKCRPVYRSFTGWKTDIRGCRRRKDLPAAALAYVDFIAEFLDTPIEICSVGPARDETVVF